MRVDLRIPAAVAMAVAASCGSAFPISASDAAAAPWDAAAPDAAQQPDAGPRCVPPCGAGEACLGTACAAVRFDALCGLGRATYLTDGRATDDEVSAQIGQAVASACGGELAVGWADLADPAVFDPATGRLLTPTPELAIAAGGFYFNPLVGALERSRVSPLYFTSDPAEGIGWAASATGAPVLLFPDESVTDGHDYFVVQLFPDGGGRLVLVAYGVGAAGTRAAGRLAESMLASPGDFTGTWHVYEWSLDAGGGAQASRLVASGSE